LKEAGNETYARLKGIAQSLVFLLEEKLEITRSRSGNCGFRL
jgi:hypothetical protein